MQIVNYFRAKVLHSSTAVFSLAMKNNKYIPFAEKTISAKNINMHRDLINAHSSRRKEELIKGKILKYERLLGSISKIKPQPYRNPLFLNYVNHLSTPQTIIYSGKENLI